MAVREDFSKLYIARNKIPATVVAKCGGIIYKIPSGGQSPPLPARIANHLVRTTTDAKGNKRLELIQVTHSGPVANVLNLSGLSKAELIGLACKALGDPPVGYPMEPREMDKQQIIAVIKGDSWDAGLPQSTAKPGEVVVDEAPEPDVFDEETVEAKGPAVVPKKKGAAKGKGRRKATDEDGFAPEL